MPAFRPSRCGLGSVLLATVKLTLLYLKMLKLKSNHIKDFPFEQYAHLNDSQLEDLAKTHYITTMNSWMLPQIAHHYGTNWQLVHGENYKVDTNLTAKKNITNDWELGLWRVCTKLKRGSLVKSQINPEFASYSALVPLILMGSKKYRGIMYMQWDIQPSCKLIDKNLLEAMLWQPSEHEQIEYDMAEGEIRYNLGSDRLIELRQQGLMVKSGPRKDTFMSPTSAWCLRGLQNTELAKAPKLVSTMLTQIWVAHPSLRTEYMILDPNAWDWMPPPLVTQDIFKHPDKEPKVSVGENLDLPWL